MAVGVFVATPVIANLAEAVAEAPMRRSTVELFGYSAPSVWFQNASIELPPDSQLPQEGALAPEIRQRFGVEVTAVLTIPVVLAAKSTWLLLAVNEDNVVFCPLATVIPPLAVSKPAKFNPPP